jgi:transcriptional regulator with XRE-family HTH domain
MEEEFTFARELIKVRIRSGLTQQQLAEKMGTTQSSVSRLESGSSLPIRILHRKTVLLFPYNSLMFIKIGVNKW